MTIRVRPWQRHDNGHHTTEYYVEIIDGAHAHKSCFLSLEHAVSYAGRLAWLYSAKLELVP
jgi:hypothetical protein